MSRRSKSRFGGGRPRNVVRLRQLTGAQLPPVLRRRSRLVEWAAGVGILLDDWQQAIVASIEDDRLEEEARSMHELGEELSLAPADVDRIITHTLQRTSAGPTDWAIARTHLAAVAGRTTV